MMTFKCKMCGGDLSFEPGASVAECPYCGTMQTLPKLDDGKRANLYDRANHFRRQNEYDKAMAIYEQILAEDRTDAEAYWSLVLCRYGIEYVEDPATRKRVPTVNRVQYASILADEDYKAALQNADSAQRGVYEAEANAIAEIQKGILDISSKEQPFDVFICYKETDANGRRTPDSVLANDMYHQLTKEGFKVFFSRITLEDKIGTAYEPYIFAALNSARVMVALGTKPEYFNAVWVKNEWSRYLALIRAGADKVLVPAYRDMDPYDLPEEFAHLQAQDMGKLGFMQDLIRGIKKLTRRDEPRPAAVQVVNAAATSAAPLVKRAFLCLEDGDFEKADDFCEQALNHDPENGRAYLGKLMVALKVRREDALKELPQPFDGESLYQKIERFGDDALKAQVRADNAHIRDRIEYERQKGVFDAAAKTMIKAAGYGDRQYREAMKLYNSAREQLQAMSDFEGASEKLVECEAQMKALTHSIYEKAAGLEKEKEWESAGSLYEMLGDYLDSRERASHCTVEKQKEMEKIAEEQHIQAELQKEYDRIAKEKRHRQAVTRTVIAVIVAAVAIGGWLLYSKVIKPNSIYNHAAAALSAGRYDEAEELFASLGEYKDAATQINESQYQKGMALLTSKDYAGAVTAFKAIEDYKDSAAATMMAMESQYQKADSLIQQGKDGEALLILRQVGVKYKDSYDLISTIEGTINGRIIAGYAHTVGLKADGTVVAVGDNDDGQCDTGEWRDIVAIAGGWEHTVGLKSDGTVVAVGDNDDGQCDTGEWRDIVAIAGGWGHTVGLKSDGTVVAVGNNGSGQCNTGEWRDIVAIAVGTLRTVGLKSDGTVVTVRDNDDGKCDTGEWRDIVAIAGGWEHTVGLKSDGTVVAVGDNNYGQCDTGEWRDIVAIAAGQYHTVGLKADGTVVAVGDNGSGKCDTGEWRDIIAIAAGSSHTVGLKADGTVVAVGKNDHGQCDTDTWKLW